MLKLQSRTLAAVLLAILSCPALATDREIDERRPLNADATVAVENVSGLIEVRGWDGKELHLTGQLDAKAAPLEISGDQKQLTIKVRSREGERDMGRSVLQLRVPAGATLKLNAVSADIQVRDTRGPISAKSVSGDVTLNVASLEVEATSVSGDVLVEAPSQNTRLDSVSGDIVAKGPGGELSAASVSGDLIVIGAVFKKLSAETVSGDVRLQVALSPEGELTVETLSGDIDLALPEEPDARVEARSFSGDTHFSPDWGRQAGRKGFSGTLKGGRGRIQLQSFSGDIDLRRHGE